jgi:hypothetical protein
MGMYDNINFEMNCPKCGKLLSDFQSKDGPCILEMLEPDSVMNFYTSCDCGEWVEFHKAQDRKHQPKLAMNDIINMGYVLSYSSKKENK